VNYIEVLFGLPAPVSHDLKGAA
jgi:hypothetical protein